MKKTLLFILLLASLAYSCKKNPTKDQLDARIQWTSDTLKSENFVYMNGDSTKAGMKINLLLVYPSASINDSLLAHIRGLFFYAFAGEGYNQMSPGEAFAQFENKYIAQARSYAAEAEDDPKDFAEYFQNINTTIVDTTSVSICALTVTREYMGGPHESHTLNYYNIDTRTGKLMNDDNLFKAGSIEKLAKLIQDELTTTVKNASGEEISLLDETETIRPNQNFYFGNKGLVYVFNPYEIATYADGIIEVTIAYEKLKEMISPNYSTIIEQKQK